MLSDHPHTLKPGCEKGGVCLVGEKRDKDLPGRVGARGDTIRTWGTILHDVRG